jgi:hypothetical protein
VVGEQYHRNATLLDNDRVAATNRFEKMEGDEIGNEDEEMKDKDWVVDGEEIWVVPRICVTLRV